MQNSPEKLIIVSGIQPSGNLHLGNYFGAVQQFIQFVDGGHECYYFLANYHALTSLRDPQRLLELTRSTAADYLALGLDPSRCSIYVQSDLPEVCELQWILTTVTPMGLLERCHAYKDKVQQGIPADHGLFAYPVLQAADILIVRANRVPVGQDQKQHVEFARDIAGSLNSLYKADLLTSPEAFIQEETGTIPGLDGRKMSKSYGNYIPIFAEPQNLKKLIMKIQTDSKTPEEPKDPDHSAIVQLYRHFATEADYALMRESFTLGGMGYSEAKNLLFEAVKNKLETSRKNYADLISSPESLEDMLAQGAQKARVKAQETLRRVSKAMLGRSIVQDAPEKKPESRRTFIPPRGW